MREHAFNIIDDIRHMLGHAVNLPVAAPKTARDYWDNLRTACASSQDILPSRLNNIRPENLRSRYGKSVLVAFSQQGFRHEGVYPGHVCEMSENYYCKLFDSSTASTMTLNRPLVITENGEVAGLMKFRRIPTILSFIDNPQHGLYPGVISTTAQSALSRSLEDMVKLTKQTGVVVVRLEDIARTPNSIRGLRMSTFSLDCGALAVFETLLAKKLLSLEDMRFNTNKLINPENNNIIAITSGVAQEILWQRGVQETLEQ